MGKGQTRRAEPPDWSARKATVVGAIVALVLFSLSPWPAKVWDWVDPPTAGVPDNTYQKYLETAHDGSCGVGGGVTAVAIDWGPQREMFTVRDPATYPVLNSISDNPDLGDERQFAGIKDALNAKSGGWCSASRVTDGEVVLMRVFVENSAADNFAGTARGTARDVALRLDSTPKISSLRIVKAGLTSTTTRPKTVWSQVELSADHPFDLVHVSGSTRVYSNAHPEGVALSDAVWDTGTPLGYQRLDGTLEPSYQYSLIVTTQMRVTYVQ